MLLTLINPTYYNILTYGADPTGTTDSTTAIQQTITAASLAGGGVCYGPAGTYLISSPLNFPTNVSMLGAGRNITIFLISASFVGSAAFSCTSVSFVSLYDFSIVGPTTLYGSNPACNGINLLGVTECFIQNIDCNYINGWGVASTGTVSIGNTNIVLDNVQVHLSAQGFHLLGVSSSSYKGYHYLFRTNASGIQNGDCYLIEDIHDIFITNAFGECTAGAGAAMHIKGACGAIFMEQCDFGPAISPSIGSVLNITAGANGSPKGVSVHGGILEGGMSGITISAGLFINIAQVNLFNNGTTGINITGGDEIEIRDCQFYQNGVVGGTGKYDLQNSATGNILVAGCTFNTPIGTGVQQVNNSVNDSAAATVFAGNFITGVGATINTIFAPGGTPNTVSNLYSVVGGAIPSPVPTLGASPATSSGHPFNYCVYLTAPSGCTVTAVAIGSNATGVTLVAGTSFLFILPAQQSITVTYSGTTPTWTWFKL